MNLKFRPQGILIVPLLLILIVTGCAEGTTYYSEPALAHSEETASTDTLMAHTTAQVKEIRKQSGIDQRVMSIDGVLSVGTAGNNNDDAWIQILVKDDSVANHVRGIIGDSLEGVPIKFALSDTIRAQ